ncbi:MAG: hypothetical protein ABJC26_03760 [Gemmatimonadaceae bacterium]
MGRPSETQKPAQHALRLDLPSIVQGGLAMLLACTIAYIIGG